MKYNRNPLSQAISTTLFAGAAASMALGSGVAFAQDADEEGVELDRVEVTGSRISRVDIEGATPVTVIDREEIDLALRLEDGRLERHRQRGHVVVGGRGVDGTGDEDGDTLPDFCFDTPLENTFMNPDLIVPGPQGRPVSRKGVTLDRNDFEQLKIEYYRLRGWDAETGLPTEDAVEPPTQARDRLPRPGRTLRAMFAVGMSLMLLLALGVASTFSSEPRKLLALDGFTSPDRAGWGATDNGMRADTTLR